MPNVAFYKPFIALAIAGILIIAVWIYQDFKMLSCLFPVMTESFFLIYYVVQNPGLHCGLILICTSKYTNDNFGIQFMNN